MFKAPWWRVAGWELVAPEIQEQTRSAAEALVALLPFPSEVREPQIVGSYARMSAMLHSDLDIHVEFLKGGDWLGTAVRSDPALPQRIVDLISKTNRALGVRIDLSVRTYSEVAAGKQVFGLRSGEWFNKAVGQKTVDFIDYDPATRERKRRPRTTGRFDVAADPWSGQVDEWAERYGDAFQHWGSTEDTAWAR